LGVKAARQIPSRQFLKFRRASVRNERADQLSECSTCSPAQNTADGGWTAICLPVHRGPVAVRSPQRLPAVSVGAADADERPCSPANPSRIDQPTCEPSADRRLWLRRWPPASARSRPAGQSALDHAASAGHSCARSSGSPLESEASATSASTVRTGWTTY
jgi:hypothetical protein